MAGVVLAGIPICAGEGGEAVAPPPVPDDLESSGAIIGAIEIDAKDVFDLEQPGESQKVFRFTNKLHRRTRERTLRRLLLFSPGDRYVEASVRESERVLRKTGFLYDAEIQPAHYENGVVDMVVKTRDVWTLTGGFSYGRKGGTNSTSIGLEDSNLMGWGKSVAIKRTSTVDRTSSLLSYSDEDMLGRRIRLDLAYSDNSDGALQTVSLGRPFFSLDSRWSAGGQWTADDRVDSLYHRGEVVDSFRHQRDFGEISGGWSHGLRHGRTRRCSVGFTFQQDRFLPVEEPLQSSSLPEDRRLNFPWFEVTWIPDRFIEVHDLDRIRRTEDRNLGHEYRARLGLSSYALGSDRQQAILDVRYQLGLSPGSRQLVAVGAGLSGRFASSRTENVQAFGAVRYYLRDWGENVLFLALRADGASNLDAENQLLLGGDNGLRGYPLRYVDGDRRFVFTAEQRLYTDWHLLKLIRVGAAAFADVGSAWSNAGDRELLRDVGVGLRLSSSRSARGALVHIDIAFPLDGDSSISGSQLLVSSRDTF